MVSFGNASGPVTGVNLGILNQKGSLYATRPSLQGYITTREELTEASNELFSLIASGVIKVDVAENQRYALKDARRAHEVLESRAHRAQAANSVIALQRNWASTREALSFLFGRM
nr:quinone oxidoreductase [Salmonella sp. NCTC 7297]